MERARARSLALHAARIGDASQTVYRKKRTVEGHLFA